jgi:hypothetical protein
MQYLEWEKKDRSQRHELLHVDSGIALDTEMSAQTNVRISPALKALERECFGYKKGQRKKNSTS